MNGGFYMNRKMYPIVFYPMPDESRPDLEYRPSTYPRLARNTYSISNYGDIFSYYLNDNIETRIDTNGYKEAKLKSDYQDHPEKDMPKRIHCRSHRLVAHEYIGDVMEADANGFVINHLDGKKLNNHYTNLEYITVQGNSKHASLHDLIAYGEHNASTKFKDSDVRIVCHFLGEGMSPSDISNNYIIEGKTKVQVYGLAYDILKHNRWVRISREYGI